MNTGQLFQLQGKVALVTGSTRGIGKEIARGLAAAGARVWVHGRGAEEVRQLATEINGAFIQADLAQESDVQRLAETIGASEERLDILVNNAGFEVIMPVEQMQMDVFDTIWRVNVRAAIQLTHLLLPLLKKGTPSSIINVTSIHDSMPYAQNSAYAASKAALAMFTRTSAIELAPCGIRVNNLAPGAIATDMNQEVIAQIGEQNFREWIPLGRVGNSEEMIGPALFLASQASSYVTGTTLYVDGGYLQHLVRYRPQAENAE